MKKIEREVLCSDCRKPLLVLFIPEDNDQNESKYYVSATCACGGESFKYGINKDMSFAPGDGLSIKEVQSGSHAGKLLSIFVTEKSE